MKREKRDSNEIRQYGLPDLEDRVIAQEEIIEYLLQANPGVPVNVRKKFDAQKTQMDLVDRDHPKRNNK